MSNSVKIKLKKIFSPCEFYFQFLEGNVVKQQDIARDQVAKIEKRLRQEVTVKNILKDAEVGQLVMCLMNSWNRWVRAKVVNRFHNGDYEVFFIDYGIKMDMRRVYSLPKEFQEDFNLIKKGSLGISPTEYWNDSIMNVCRELDKNRRSDIELRFVLICQKEDLYIGDIFVLSPSGNYSLTERLKSCDEKIVSESNFKRIFETLSQASQPKQTFPHNKIEIDKTYDLATISRVFIHQKNFIPPPNLFIHGETLKSQWNNIEDTLFDKSIKKELSKIKMTDIQRSIWPQLHSSYGHAVIIANQIDLSSLYLPVLINNIHNNPSHRASKPEFMGPIAIIFVHNSSRADEMTKMSEQIGRNFKIVKAVGFCDNKMGEIINGCDILVTTLPAFTRLTSNIALKVIDVNRLKHVAFDGFNLIPSKYEKDLDRVMKFCLLDVEKVPQIIVTSTMFTSDIKQKFLNQLPREKTVVCIDNFIEGAVYAGMEVKVEICSSFDEKIEKLMKAANLKNSLIIVNDKDEQKLKDIFTSSKVVTDSSALCLKNVENLVHFSSAKNWRIFVQRFESMKEKIEDKLQGKDVKLSTTVLFDEQEINEFEALMTFMVNRKIYKGNSSMLEKLKQKREVVKCEKNTKLCIKLLQFSNCGDQYCADRHILSSLDKCIDTFTNHYIKFRHISMNSPTEFIIKVQEYSKNGQWISLKEEDEKIEKMLSEDLQKCCEDASNNLKLREGKIGSIYAKFDATKKLWIRAKMIERNSPTIVKLYLIDQCTTAHALESQLMSIPSEISSLRPLMHKLNIINLIPLDGELNYSNYDTEKLQKEISKVDKLTFTCKVQMAFNDMLFTDNFEAKNAKKVVKFRLQFVHLKLGISEVDADVCSKLKRLIGTDIKVREDQPKIEMMKVPPVEKKSIELWKELKCGKFYSFKISHYTSPYSFFVVIDSSENFVLKEWMKKIEDFSNLQQLSCYQAGTSCLITHNGINKRAKILIIKDDEAQLLLVDFGEIVSEKVTSLYELPEDFKDFRYQAVHCSLCGIRPKFNMKFWPLMQKSVIHNLIKEREWSLKVVRRNEKQHEFSHINLNSYAVVLVDGDKEYLHKIAIEKFYANADEVIESSDEEESEINDNTEIIPSDSGYKTSDSEEVPSYNLKELQRLVEIYQKSIEAKGEKREVIAPMKPSLLTNLFNHPYIEWRQNEFLIYLVITAKDCVNYSINIDEATADIVIVYSEKKVERSVLQLYGLITPKLCSHDLNGGSIILRLAKKTVDRAWPRLTQDKSTSTFIKFSDENVPYIHSTVMSCGISYPPDLSDNESESNSSEEFKDMSSDDDTF